MTLSRRLLLLLAISVAFLVRPADGHARATALLMQLSGASALSMIETPVGIESVDLPMELSSATAGHVRARLYLPTSRLPSLSAPRGMILVHGVHFLGIDEPRLVALSKAFAQAGMVVLTPELPALADYRVDDPSNLEVLRASVQWLARRTDVVRKGGVGLLGVSFAGGLALRVASEPSVGADLAFVASIGGHHDMRRVARFFVTDHVEGPEGDIAWKAHDYGLAVLVYNSPERFVSIDDAPHLRSAVRHFLHESYGAAQQAALRMSPEGRVVFDRIYNRDRLALAARVLDAIPALEKTMEAASPVGHVAAIRVPIFLLHGAHDDVVPPSESRWVAKEATSPVHILVTTKIGHAELGEGGTLEVLALVHFMAEMIDT
jgi:pimeloyl-ACP methyl ester carboxylesterase